MTFLAMKMKFVLTALLRLVKPKLLKKYVIGLGFTNCCQSKRVRKPDFLNPFNRRSTHSRWHGRICGLVIETNENVYGPFFADTCGYEVWEIVVDTDLVTYLTDNAITNDDGDLIGFTTEPNKG